MYSLIFVLCVASSNECRTIANEGLYTSEAVCEGLARGIMQDLKPELDANGDVAEFQCVTWTKA